jgi:hypothetical protein
LASDRPPKYVRVLRPTLADGVEAQVRALLAEFPRMPATVIAQRIGWAHSMTTLKDRVRAIRPEYVGIDPVDRVVYQPGQFTQCDLWFPETPIPVGPGQERVLPVLVMTLAFSRFLTATMIPSRQAGDILSGMWALISQVGRVTSTLVWDRESAIGGTGRVSAPAAAFAGTLATRIRLAPPRDPEFKGITERNNGFFETSFLPGRRFSSPADFNTQLGGWLPVANTRTVRSINGRPVDLLDTDHAAMVPLPPVDPQVGLTHRIRLARDYYVRVDTCDYSVDPRMIGRFVDVTASPRHRPRSRCSAMAGSSPVTDAAGPSAWWSPTRPTSLPRHRCAAPWPVSDTARSTSASSCANNSCANSSVGRGRASTPTGMSSRCAHCLTTTPCSASTSPTSSPTPT